MSIVSPLISTSHNPHVASPTRLLTAHAKWRIMRHLTLALIGVFFLTTLRDGHTWGDDFAQYLQHADNIVHSVPYAETGYIYNPQNAIVGPQAYPPAYPTALAPVAALCGANLNAYKALGVFFFLMTLLVATRLFSNDLSARNVWICLTVVGFSPIFWAIKDGIMSEHLFVPLWYGAVLATDDWYRRQKIYGNQTLHGIILGMLIFLTCATRTVGIVLLPMVVICEALLARRVTRVGILALLTAISLLVAERLVFPASGAGYIEQLSGISVSQLLANAYSDTTSFSLIWQNGHWDSVRRIAGAGFAVLAAIGFLRANVWRPTPLGTAMAAYFAVIVIWPSADGLRMILPLLPAFVFYVLVGMNALRLIPDALRPLSSLLKNGSRPRAATVPEWFFRGLLPTCTAPLQSRLDVKLTASAGSLALLLFSLFSFGAAYATADFGPIPTGIATRPAAELFEFVRKQTRPDEVCLFFKPRALALYTGRRSSAFPLGTDEHAFWEYAEAIGAKIIIVRDEAADRIDEDQTSEMAAPFAARDIEEVFHNSMFRAYRWKPSLHAAQ